MNKESNSLVVEFLLSRINPFYYRAYNTLAALKYPLSDHLTLLQQLESQGKSMGKEQQAQEDRGATRPEELVLSVLQPADFPIETPQNALEKFHDSLLTLTELGGFPENPREELEAPTKSSKAPHPEDVSASCRQAMDRARENAFARNPDISSRDLAWVGLRAFFECMSRWAPGRLVVSKRTSSPEAFVWRS